MSIIRLVPDSVLDNVFNRAYQDALLFGIGEDEALTVGMNAVEEFLTVESNNV